MQKSPFKKEKLQDQILTEINRILRTETSDKRLRFVSVTKVEINKDYSFAKVFWDTFDSTKRGDAKEALIKSVGRIRYSPDISPVGIVILEKPFWQRRPAAIAVRVFSLKLLIY